MAARSQGRQPWEQVVWRVALSQDASDAGETAKATRRFHTRSRAGCAKCKERHIRCDEKRPSCSRCIERHVSCYYDPPKVPLRERKAQSKPGEQTPWVIESLSGSSPKPSHDSLTPTPPSSPGSLVSTSWQYVPWESIDPFGAMSISMPFKSKELLHSFFQGNNFATGPLSRGNAFIFQDPHSLQNLLLNSGIYQGWARGTLGTFKPTYLFHKVQTIHLVNTLIENSPQVSDVALCAKKIASLCFTECYFGNVQLTEVHLHGLIRYMESRESVVEQMTNAEKELVDRYLILAYSIVVSLQFTRPGTPKYSVDPTGHSKYVESENLICRRNLYGASGFEQRLKAIQMFPFFLGSALPKQNHQIDVRPIIHFLKEITVTIDSNDNGTSAEQAKKIFKEDFYILCWPKIVHMAVNIHMSSLFGDPQKVSIEENVPISSWSGICVAGGVYITNILSVAQGTSPEEVQQLRYFIRLLQRDARNGLSDLTGNSTVFQNLWLWKVFVGAVSLANIQSHVPGEWFQDTWLGFSRYIGMWAMFTGVRQWVEVKQVLATIAWPANSSRELVAESIWNRRLTKACMP